MGATFDVPMDTPLDEALTHHGIKGQKWGVRRFQNEDGSLTAAGRSRYGVGGDLRVFGASGDSSAKTKTPDWDHSKSDKSELVRYIANVALDVALNPLMAVENIPRGVAALSSSIKEKANNTRISQLEVDKETGLHLKSQQFTPEQDLAKVNPGIYNFDANTKNNCMLCTTAYEMRRRGYDVTANKASYGYDYSNVSDWFPKAKVETVHQIDFKNTTLKQRMAELAKANYGMNKELATKTVDALKAQGNGARGNLMVDWGTGSGHSMFYEVSNGNVVIRDAQINKTYTKPEKILRRCVGSSYARLDNVDFDKKRIKEAVS